MHPLPKLFNPRIHRLAPRALAVGVGGGHAEPVILKVDRTGKKGGKSTQVRREFSLNRAIVNQVRNQ